MLAELTFGVLGLGSIGTRHARNLLADGQKVLAFDPSPDRLTWAKAQGMETSTSRTEVLEKSDALIIASPNESHLADLDDGISANCHCFVEKPLAHTAEGLEVILKKAENRKLQVFAGMNLRFHPAVQEAKKLVDQGAIGTPLWATLISAHYLPSWRPHQDYKEGYTANPVTGGVIFDIIHEFDLANFLLGRARTVAAVARNTGAIGLNSEDCADIILTHESGLNSSLHLNYITRPPQRLTKIGGVNGVIELDLIKRTVVLFSAEGDTIRMNDFSSTTSSDDYVTEMKAFIRCISENIPSPCSGYDALAVLVQVIAAREKCGLPQT